MLIYNPRQMVFVTCRGEFSILGKKEEKDDVIPTTWHTPISAHPLMYAIALKKGLMGEQLIRSSGGFVVNFVPFTLSETAKKAMGLSGEYVEKCDTIGVHELPCEKLTDSFRLKEAIGWLECEVVEEKEIGDHILFIGKVLHSEMGYEEKRLFHVQGEGFTTTK